MVGLAETVWFVPSAASSALRPTGDGPRETHCRSGLDRAELRICFAKLCRMEARHADCQESSCCTSVSASIASNDGSISRRRPTTAYRPRVWEAERTRSRAPVADAALTMSSRARRLEVLFHAGFRTLLSRLKADRSRPQRHWLNGLVPRVPGVPDHPEDTENRFHDDRDRHRHEPKSKEKEDSLQHRVVASHAQPFQRS